MNNNKNLFMIQNKIFKKKKKSFKNNNNKL